MSEPLSDDRIRMVELFLKDAKSESLHAEEGSWPRTFEHCVPMLLQEIRRLRAAQEEPSDEDRESVIAQAVSRILIEWDTQSDEAFLHADVSEEYIDRMTDWLRPILDRVYDHKEEPVYEGP